uniref:Uncharacterized protein n=1 Tax=Octopus bimaculoides TaxID=37653 RepID=A0A0L8H4L9_OCTBM
MTVVIEQPTIMDRLLEAGLFVGAIFQLICIFAIIVLPTSVEEKAMLAVYSPHRTNDVPLTAALERVELQGFKAVPVIKISHAFNSFGTSPEIFGERTNRLDRPHRRTLSTTSSKEVDTTTEASFVMSWNIARTKRPYSDGEFKNIAEVVAMFDPNNTRLQQLIAQTPVSRQPTEKRISQISAKVADNPQLAVFIRYVSSDVTVKEEMLDLVALKETASSVDIKNALDRTLTHADVPLNKLVSVATGGAPAMVGENVVLIALMKKMIPAFQNFSLFIALFVVAARYFKCEDVMKSILEIVNFKRCY